MSNLNARSLSFIAECNNNRETIVGLGKNRGKFYFTHKGSDALFLAYYLGQENGENVLVDVSGDSDRIVMQF
jgi:hypothetical protein|tara:strand:+ start:1098 stop:1313 length:216 start_codon:yes stop_codon:yes gene_type:complete